MNRVPREYFKKRDYCDQHLPVQHRDNRPPWCYLCGREDDTNQVLTEPHSKWTGALGYRYLPDDRVIVAEPLFGFGIRIHIGPPDCGGSDHSWDFNKELVGNAVAALASWDGNGEPTGWYRDNATRRRRPHGDPEREHADGEYVEPT